MSVINDAVEAVMDMIDGLDLFAPITRGALGTDSGLACEIAPSMPSEVYMDKDSFTPLSLVLNGKNGDLQTVSDALNTIIDNLTRRTEYPAGNGWEIVDITSGTLPRIIGREPDNKWLMAGNITVKLYRKDEES